MTINVSSYLRLGKYQGTRGPGIVIILPFLESATVVDLREKFLGYSGADCDYQRQCVDSD